MRRKNLIPFMIIMILVLWLPAKSSENFSQRIGIGFLSAPFPVFGFSLTYNVTEQVGIQAFGRIAIVDVDFIAGRILYRFYKTDKLVFYAAGLVGYFYEGSVSRGLLAVEETDSGLGFGAAGGIEFTIQSLKNVGFNLEIGFVHIAFQDVWWDYDYKAPTLVMLGFGFHYYF